MPSLGGRPEEEGGHKARHISLDAKTRDALAKAKKRKIDTSEFVEFAIRPYDPKMKLHLMNWGLSNGRVYMVVQNDGEEDLLITSVMWDGQIVGRAEILPNPLLPHGTAEGSCTISFRPPERLPMEEHSVVLSSILSEFRLALDNHEQPDDSH